ncbi:putative P-loop containing nucleoside triphosphate hydrolase, leucine-rich repeat domain superfamily [Helianthus annuus]|nr:putative P-loop containing nucleoside triphosphate hydrolase, leucine-rich repeat domain superfamily [Helianthus annuus]KAJ0952135.1 putative P-loop containing nucleoside triphosphate hydrolase, leucine-rich repeat domain superfamily [Helianthus annuus]
MRRQGFTFFQGLPLAVVVIAGVLAKEVWSEKLWMEIAERTSSYIVGDQNGCLETLALSYSHLPLHLRECFLYLGGFPEDYDFQVQRLIWLWVAEGFIEQAGDRRLEDIAEGYLMDLIDRNLVIVAGRRKSNGAVKACKVHDLVRELCLRQAKEERFILETERVVSSSQFSFDVTTPPYKPVRVFISKYVQDFPDFSAQNLRSILCFSDFKTLSDGIAKYFRSFVLLSVLDLQKCRLNGFPQDMELLVHLRYLAIWNSSAGFPSSICNLWNLQTLIYITSYFRVVLPSNISNLVNLRHLWSYLHSDKKIMKMPFFLPTIVKPMKLQSISNVVLGDGVDDFLKCFPCIKELTCPMYVEEDNDFESLTYLEKLKLTGLRRRMKSTMHDSPKGDGKNHITFPATLKTLKLVGCHLPWSDMSIIQSLPNLQVLKLRNNAFNGSCWNTDEQQFRQLKSLRLEGLNIKLWEAYSKSFPCLKQLEIFHCYDLDEISLEVGDIPTLEMIKINNCSNSIVESVRRIQAEQHEFGNYGLQIEVSGFDDFSL